VEQYEGFYKKAIVLWDIMSCVFLKIAPEAVDISLIKPQVDEFARVNKLGNEDDDFVVKVALVEKHFCEISERRNKGDYNKNQYTMEWSVYYKQFAKYSFIKYNQVSNIYESVLPINQLRYKIKYVRSQQNLSSTDRELEKTEQSALQAIYRMRRECLSHIPMQELVDSVKGCGTHKIKQDEKFARDLRNDGVSKVKEEAVRKGKSNRNIVSKVTQSISDIDLIAFLNRYANEKNPFAWKDNLIKHKYNPKMIEYAPERGAWIPVEWATINYLATIKPKGCPRYVIPIGSSVNNSQVREWYDIEGSGEIIVIARLAKAKKNADKVTSYKLDGEKGKIFVKTI
jgi:hypothetical protein